MIEYIAKNAKRWSVLGERPTLGLSIFELAKADPNIMVVNADVTNSAGLGRMKEALPDQVINVGIAEQNMMLIATGLASEGYKVFTTTFAPFQSMRCLEQIRVYQGYMQQKLIMVGLLSGVASGYLGHTHCTTEDVSLLRSIPNIAVVTPADCMEVAKSVEAAVSYNKSVYIRLMGNSNIPVIHSEDFDFQIGKGMVLHEGADAAIIVNGPLVFPAMKAAENLEAEGKHIEVINMHTVKPLDTGLLDDLCRKGIRNILTAEEHSTIGGLGSAVSEYLIGKPNSPRVKIMGIPDEYPHGASEETLLQKYDLTAEGLVKQIKEMMEEN